MNKVNTYDLGEELIKALQELSKQRGDQKSINYAWLCGNLQAIMKMMPNSKDNIAYLKDQIRMSKMG